VKNETPTCQLLKADLEALFTSSNTLDSIQKLIEQHQLRHVDNLFVKLQDDTSRV
jgi:hypothetical protein